MGACGQPENAQAEPRLTETRATEKRPHQDFYKILLIGDSAVGKSSIILRFSDDQFSDNFIATVGVDFKVRDFEIEGETIKLQIWDTAGQERFRTITSSFFRGAHAIVIVYDITKQPTFRNVTTWLDEISRQASPQTKRILVGNKSDLSEEREVETNAAKDFAKSKGLPFYEVSARTGENVREVFHTVAKLVHCS